MRPMLDRKEVVRELHAGISAEWGSEFPQLGRIPSTGVRKFIDYVAGLGTVDRGVLAAALAENASEFLFPVSDKPPLYKRNEAYRKWADTAVHMTGPRYSSVRALLGTVALEAAAPPPAPPRRPRMAYAKPSLLLAEAKRKRI